MGSLQSVWILGVLLVIVVFFTVTGGNKFLSASNFGLISQNIAVLRKAGLVTERREANRRFYLADQQALGSLRPALEEMWALDLDRLRSVVEEG